ncbi:MAG: hypothetical protein M9958_05145 [Chitinophagales bacterium]|nr:hypothetical protein [Chitinophagales bacterium]
MKRMKSLLVPIFLISFYACTPSVTFSEPQPTETDNLSEFPKRLQGQYLSLDDNSTLEISDQMIRRIYDYDTETHSNQLDSASQPSGDTIINPISNEKSLITRDGDSLITHVHKIDTLFLMSSDNIAREFKGYYFLSTRYKQSSWIVKKIQLTREKLILSSISTQLDIEHLREITDSPTEKAQIYEFTPSKKQFKKFVKNNGFRDREILLRLK